MKSSSPAILPILCKNSRARIDILFDSNNNEVMGAGVPEVFVNHYEAFLGMAPDCDMLDTEGLLRNKVSDAVASDMVRPISNEEIRCTMFDIGGDRAPRPDGFTSALFKKGFHPTMIKWIMACVSSASFSICINGDVHGFIKGKRGLRQGDPLSPYLFTLVMEVLTLILKRRVSVSETFRYHHYCDELELINVCFADDLFIFARGDTNSVCVIMEGLDEFKKTSGLVPSLPKITVFFFNVPNYVKNEILNIMPFAEGKLPVRYLGVPLISSRLLNRDCKALVNQAKNRIGDWKNKSLSFAGRLQLYTSVLSSMQVFWASVLLIPKGIVYDIHQLIRGFLWCNGEYKRGKAKVAWDVISLPKAEGGLGIRSLEMFNIALMTKYIWSDISKRKSLWLWGTVWPYFWSKIGNGGDTSVLFDNWCPYSPIAKQITPRNVANAGYSMACSVADLVADGAWNWPQHWLMKAPNIGILSAPDIN
ncbi:hypothetical protein Tco_0655490 [Tanacetum coccineum]|uniref:Reverse transcriptase domain-containing protein n=1 Tax=Tanacetum coccineum TaxID=301880 RepID=A0ABQ4X789_9ASTR